MIQRNVRGLLGIAETIAHMCCWSKPLANRAGNVERESKRKKKSIHQSAQIGAGVKGVEIGPTDLSISTQGLPDALHDSRQRYASKADREDHSQVGRCHRTIYVTHPLMTVGE